MPKVNIPASGAAGTAPPPDAPQETAMPLSPDAGGIVVFDPGTKQPTGEIVTPAERAAKNERQLAPLQPPGKPLSPEEANARLIAMGMDPLPILPETPPVPAKSATESLIADVFGDDLPAVVPDRPTVVVAGQGTPIHDPSRDPLATGNPLLDPMLDPSVDQFSDVLPELSAEDRARMPAASNSDTPTKGLLPDLTPPRGDKFEGISRGGFADAGDAQYYPLAGNELGLLIIEQLDRIKREIPNDLRFSFGLVYPRVRVVIRVEVEGAAEDRDNGIQIQKIVAPKDGKPGSTPLEIARRYGDLVCFVVEATRQEFDSEGNSDSPPDQIRDELGLPKPRKTFILGENGQQIAVADIAAPGQDLQALMSH